MNSRLTSRLPPLPSAETLGWGIVGASTIAATSFLPALRALPEVATRGSENNRYPAPNSVALGVFSHNDHRARAFADHHAVPHPFLNLADLLAQPSIHCIYVGNHPRHHAQTVLAALAAGKHVFCEPPLALTVDEAEQVAHTALDRGRILALNFQHRGDAALQTLRELLADHTIGDLLGGRVSNTSVLATARQSWRLRAQGGGVLIDRTAHSLDLLRFLLRDEIEQVYSASTQQFLGDQVEEDVLSIFTLRRNGIAIQTHDSFVVAPVPVSIELYGNAGTLTVYDCWRSDRPTELWIHRHGQSTRLSTATTSTEKANTEKTNAEKASPFQLSLQAFVQAVRTQGAPLAGGADGVNNMAVLHAAKVSLGRGQRIPVALPMRRANDRAFS